MSGKSGDRIAGRALFVGTSDPACGVSEVIGSFLLISIVVLAVAIIAMVLLSQTGPQEIPNVNFMVGTDRSNPPNLYLYHNGGDPLTVGDFSVLVDGVATNYHVMGGGSIWSLGKTVNITLALNQVPKNVVLVYNRTGTNAVVLRSASVNISSMPNNINPDVLSGVTFPPVIDVTQLTQNVNNRSIDFYQENGTAPTGTLKFNVTGTNSTIYTISGSIIPLLATDVVQITTSSSAQSLRIAGIGNQIWELNGDNVNLVISNRSTPINSDFNNISYLDHGIPGYAIEYYR